MPAAGPLARGPGLPLYFRITYFRITYFRITYFRITCYRITYFRITYFSTDFSNLPISAGFFVVRMPHSSITDSFSSAVPLPPEIIAPA